MIAALLAAAALAPAYAAHTDEGRRLTITVRGARVTRVRTSVVRYECDLFGDVGPVSVRVAPDARDARVDRRGRFSFVTGTPDQRVGVAGTLKHGRATGRIRVSGTIATGERCASPTLRFG